MNRRTIIAAALVAFIATAGYAGWQAYLHRNDGHIVIHVVPHDAIIPANGRSYGKSRNLSLAPGFYSLEVGRAHFTTQTASVTVTKGITTDQRFALVPSDDAGNQYYKDHPDEALEGQGFTGATANEQGRAIQAKNGLIGKLPELHATWRIDFGTSRAHPDDPSAVAIIITATDDYARQQALAWIRQQGYDPAAYEIVYQTPQDAAGHD